MFAATIDRFESLEGLGVEAKTRQLDRKIEQADEALRRLEELAELTGAALVDPSSKMGRWDSAPSPRAAYALVQKVRSKKSPRSLAQMESSGVCPAMASSSFRSCAYAVILAETSS